ncbi:MAG: small subunit ribosomal protein S3 [Microgenomates group bacterium LiPW_16]|nr:MAG: small subunit ribosomal protein S3 [Microgenomates group bacterium LiPW_16]
MGQKVNPKAARLGILYTWDSRWFVKGKKYKELLSEDIKIRKALMKKLGPAGISRVEIERSINKIDITLHVSRPGVVIGRGGVGLEEVKKFIEGIVSRALSKIKVEIKVEPIKEPNLDAYLVATNIADQLAKRFPHRRVVRATIERVMTAGARGIKIVLSGRIAGADISRRETYKAGTIPLSTLRENIDFVAVPSLTRSGYIGVKVWICK